MTGSMPYPDDLFDMVLEQADLSPKHKRRGVYEAMQKSPIDWSCSAWAEQPECLNFCKALLAFDPQERLQSAQDALAQKWLNS